jgi:hypothetical protein
MPSTNQPATPFIDLVLQAVTEAMTAGAITINNFPATQPVSGSVQTAASTSTTVTTRIPGYTPAASPGTIPLTSTPTLCDSVFIRAVKNTGGFNSGLVFVGTSGGATNQTISIEPGGWIRETAPAGKKLDLSQIYIRVLDAGDAVSWIASN